MTYAVILAHPKPTSFCAAIARTCLETLQVAGKTAILRDLYAMDFDPRLKSSEMPTPQGWTMAPDVVAERQRLSDAAGFIFVYPFWCNAPPAILKGYVDRVLSMGFGYLPNPHGGDPLLVGKTLLSFSTSGAPEEWVHSTGALNALMTVFDLHLSAVCGLRVAGHEHFGEVVPMMTQEAGANVLARVANTLKSAL